MQKSVPIQPKTSNILPKFCRSAVVSPTFDAARRRRCASGNRRHTSPDERLPHRSTGTLRSPAHRPFLINLVLGSRSHLSQNNFPVFIYFLDTSFGGAFFARRSFPKEVRGAGAWVGAGVWGGEPMRRRTVSAGSLSARLPPRCGRQWP